MVRRWQKKPSYKGHIDNGWPHFSSANPHHCICLDKCCQSPDTGCICKRCPCRMGILHEPYLATEIAGIDQQREERKNHESRTR